MRFSCWCFLFARAFSFATVTTSDHVSRADQLLGDGINSGRRTGRLYCRVGIGFHLQIHPDGRVNGTHEPNQLSLLELFAISQGVVGIRGAFSRRFLSMNKRGWLHAIEEFTDDCKFRERFQDSSYNTYSSLMHRSHRSGKEWFVALNKRGKAKMGSNPRVKPQHASTQFLPRFNLPDRSHWGFTVMGRSQESQNAPQPAPPKAPPPMVKVDNGQKRPQPVKYWPKFRFG